jgi:hypothetical protein
MLMVSIDISDVSFTIGIRVRGERRDMLVSEAVHGKNSGYRQHQFEVPRLDGRRHEIQPGVANGR